MEATLWCRINHTMDPNGARWTLLHMLGSTVVSVILTSSIALHSVLFQPSKVTELVAETPNRAPDVDVNIAYNAMKN